MIAGIIGATGYAGAELVRLLAAHPEVSGLKPASVSHHGERLDGVYPHLAGFEGKQIGSLILDEPEAVIAASDIVFGALPAGAGESYVKACLDRGISYIDLSADFRFDGDGETYTAWYGKSWQYPELRERCVYGLPELNRDRIRALASSGPVVIGNPGCYPTAVSLACYPALAAAGPSAGAGPETLIAPGAPVIADAVSGVTGAGRDPGRAYHFPECSDSVTPYKIGAHRHTPEISRNLSIMAGRPVRLVFTPHLGPFNRGILATVYLSLAGPGGTPAGNAADFEGVRPQDKGAVEKAGAFRTRYADFYKGEPFVRVLPPGLNAATNRVRQSNFCDISVHADQTGTMLIVVSAIDNMVKGAAGQAVQNMNLVCGFEETSGLKALPALF
jgi:N-acetyl-gamma-glutamyl-phosphate reductase